MVKDPHHGIEHHMRFNEILARAAEERTPPRKLGPYVTISRQLGSGGSEIARRLGKELGWIVLDRELVEHLAEKLDDSRAEFIRRNFHCDVNDPQYYDLVLSSTTFGVDGAVQMIREALRRLAPR